MSEFKSVKFITPKLTLQYPKLNRPDTKWKPEGEYSAKGPLEDMIPVATLEKIEAMLAAFLENKKAELTKAKQAAKAKSLVNKGLVFLKAETDGETGDETGRTILSAKMKAQYKNKKTGEIVKRVPDFVDAKGKPIAKAPDIWGGTVAKLGVSAACYYAPNDNAVGVTLYLDAVQIIKLVSKGGGSQHGFSEEEGGYEHEDEPAGFQNESEGSTSGTEEEDF